MGKQVFLFWPGDGRKAPNDLARPSMEKATRQLEQALRKLGREPRLIEGFIAKPHESIEKLGPINDPMIAVCVHCRDEWWTSTTRVWPFMAADLGMSRDSLMAHYMSNHIAVAYGDIFGEMVALSEELGFRVRIISHAN